MVFPINLFELYTSVCNLTIMNKNQNVNTVSGKVGIRSRAIKKNCLVNTAQK